MKSLFGSLLSIALFFPDLSNAQIPNFQWTWVQGDSVKNRVPVYGTKGVPSINNTPGARNWVASWTDTAGIFWIFGGTTQSANHYDDLWKYNPTTNEWTWMKGDTAMDAHGVYGTRGVEASIANPGGREGSVTWTDTANNLWLYGGRGYSSNAFGYQNDLWRYNAVTNNWTWINGDTSGAWKPANYGTMGIPSSSNTPGGRLTGNTWSDKSGNLWLFSGTGISASGNDIWRYEIATNTWTWMKGDNTSFQIGIYGTKGVTSQWSKPSSRIGSVSWLDTADRVWIFGGDGYSSTSANGYQWLNDLWMYDPATNQWTWISGDSIGNQKGNYQSKMQQNGLNNPGGKMAPIAWLDKEGNFWLFGGDGRAASVGGEINDLWMFKPSTGIWTWISGDTVYYPPPIYNTKGLASAMNTPGGRRRGAAFKDKVGNFMLFGCDCSRNDVWRLNVCSSTIPVISQSGSILSTAPLYTSYQWYRNDTLIPFATAAQYQIPFAAAYYVIVTDTGGCQTKSNTIGTITDIANISTNQFSIFPNPTSDYISLVTLENLQYTISDLEGQILMLGMVHEGKNILNTKSLIPGFYLIKLVNNRRNIFTQKFIKQN